MPNEVLLSFDTEIQVGDEEAVIEILNILKEHDAKSTFFVMGAFVENNPEIILKMINEGHEVACHTQNHKRLLKISEEEIEKEIKDCKVSIENLTNETIIGFRAPWRMINLKTFEVLKEQGFVYDASLFEKIPFYSRDIKEIKTSTKGVIPLDDYIMTRTLHIPKTIYFFMLKNSLDNRVSISFHPHIIIEHKQEFSDLIEYYHQKNTKFLTHKQTLEI